MCLKHLLIHTRLQVGHSHQHVFDLLTPSALSYLPVFSSTFHRPWRVIVVAIALRSSESIFEQLHRQAVDQSLDS